MLVKRVLYLLFFVSSCAQAFASNVVTYELTVGGQAYHPGNPKWEAEALTINGQIPAPTIRAKVGDILEVKVYNDLEEEDTIIHWHGVLLPND